MMLSRVRPGNDIRLFAERERKEYRRGSARGQIQTLAEADLPPIVVAASFCDRFSKALLRREKHFSKTVFSGYG